MALPASGLGWRGTGSAPRRTSPPGRVGRAVAGLAAPTPRAECGPRGPRGRGRCSGSIGSAGLGFEAAVRAGVWRARAAMIDRQPGERVDAELVHGRGASPSSRCSMPSSSKRPPYGVAGPLVERQRAGLGVHPDADGAGRARLLLGGGQQRGGKAAPARPRTHRRANSRSRPARSASGTCRPPRRRRRRAAAPRRRGRRGRRRTDALLAAEDLLAQRESGGELLLVAGPAELRQDR